MNKSIYLGLLASAVMFAAGWTASSWKKDKQIAQLELSHANYLRDLAEHNAKTINDLFSEAETKQQALTELDQKHYQELSHEQKANQQLIAELASAKHRLSVRIDPASCPSMSTTSKTPSLDDAARTRAELHPTAAADIFRIAAQANECSKKLTGLQDFIEKTLELYGD